LFFFISAFSNAERIIKVLCPDEESITFMSLELRMRQIQSSALFMSDRARLREEAIRKFQLGECNIILFQYQDRSSAHLKRSDYTYWFETPPSWLLIFQSSFCHPNSRVVLLPQSKDEINRVTFSVALACLQVNIINAFFSFLDSPFYLALIF
jgi:hypothetical protein